MCSKLHISWMNFLFSGHIIVFGGYMKIILADSKWKKFKLKVVNNWKKIKIYEVENSRGRIDLLIKRIQCRYNFKTQNTEKKIEKIIKSLD